jgi:hypothetical protein
MTALGEAYGLYKWGFPKKVDKAALSTSYASRRSTLRRELIRALSAAQF